MIKKTLQKMYKKETLEVLEPRFDKFKEIVNLMGFNVELKDDEIAISNKDGDFIGNMGNYTPVLGGGYFASVKTPRGLLKYKYSDDKNDKDSITLSDYSMKEDRDGKIEFKGTSTYVESRYGKDISILLVKPNAKNKEIRFEIGENSFYASIDNAVREYGDHKNGTKRSVGLDDNKRFTTYENNNKGHATYLDAQSDGRTILMTSSWKNYERMPNDVYEFDKKDYPNMLQQLIASPRTKNLVDYNLSEIELAMPGMIDYLNTNYILMPVLQKAMNSGVKISPKVQEFWNKCHVSEADLDSEKKDKTKEDDYLDGR